MNKLLAPLKSETVEEDGEHLEVIVLLVANDVNHLVDGIVSEAHLCSTDVLCHVNAGAVGTEEQLLVESLVGKVSPYRVVRLAEEESLGESFLHLLLSYEVSVRLIVDLVEAYAECLVCLVETSVHPVVHLLPESANLRIVVLPLNEHFVSLLDERSLSLCLLSGSLFVHALSHILGLKLCHFLTVVLVESHIVVADKVVALLA